MGAGRVPFRALGGVAPLAECRQRAGSESGDDPERLPWISGKYFISPARLCRSKCAGRVLLSGGTQGGCLYPPAPLCADLYVIKDWVIYMYITTTLTMSKHRQFSIVLHNVISTSKTTVEDFVASLNPTNSVDRKSVV